MLAVLKHQQFGDSGSDEIELRRSKRQRLDEYDNEERNGLDDEEGNSLDEDEGEIEGGGYIPLPHLPQKVSNRPSDLSKGIRSLKHIICIPTICYS